MLNSWLHNSVVKAYCTTVTAVCNDYRTVDVRVMLADLTVQDNGNYTCEIRGNKSNVLASKTFSITVQGAAWDKMQQDNSYNCSLEAVISLSNDVELYRRFPDSHFPGQTFPGQDVSRTRRFPDKHFPGQTFPGQVILRNFHVHSVVNTSSIGLVTRHVGIRSVYWCVLVGLQLVYGDYSVKRVVQQWVKRKLCYD